MAEVFRLPAVGDTMVEGEIVEWFVAVGDTVELDQTICSLETDKSVVEMTTPHRGTVLQLGGEVGDLIEVGAPLLVVGEPGEAAEIDAGSAAAAPDAHPEGRVDESDAPGSAKVASPVLRKLAGNLGVDVGSLAGTGPGGRVTRDDVVVAGGRNGRALAMPKVRRAAREGAIDLHSLTGSGPHGSITLDDLAGAPAAGGTFARDRPAGGRRERLSATRRAIGKHLTESAQQIPQFTSMVEVDATALVATRAALVARHDGPVPFDAVLMALMVPVLREHPVINAMLDGDEIVYHDRFDLGVAVDTPGGLMLPVVRDVNQRSIADLSAEIVRLAAAARERAIHPDELSGATCTLNNVGALGIVAGTPILPLGTSTIVAFGRTRPVLQLRNGNVVEVPTMTISATFDHRLIDGGDSGRFLNQLKQHLEVPALGLLQ
jgi:pyruvate dehydrogenase E2 component (dihydrolipoamide acetyltransferase)